MFPVNNLRAHQRAYDNGHDYLYFNGPEYFHTNGTGRRAIFAQYQTYPLNDLQSGSGQSGTLVVGVANGAKEFAGMGNHWRTMQPAQVWKSHNAVVADLLGGGTDAEYFASQPLTYSQATAF